MIFLIYLDNASTTMVMPQAAEAAMKCFSENFGNPSSLHHMGFEAEKALERARSTIAETLCCKTEEIIFTHSATFANNLAIIGAAEAYKRHGHGVVLSTIEHSSVLAVGKELSSRGFLVSYARANKDGTVAAENVAALVNNDTILVSVMHINSETGAINNIKAIAGLCRRKNPRVLIHCDCVQSYGKYDLCELRKYVDMISVAGHKINGPKGAAFLYKKSGVRLKPLYFGATQESGLFSGTQNVPAIVGMAKAAQLHHQNLQKNYDKLSELNIYLRRRLKDIEGIVINSSDGCAPYILNISVMGYKSEVLLHFLGQRGIYVSSGSACAKGKPSHVLTAMGLPKENIDSALRISMCAENTKQDIDEFCEALILAISSIRQSQRR